MSNQTDHLEGEELLNAFLAKEYAGRIAVSSSFGAEFVALLDMVARINPQTPVIFLGTGMHSPETLEYMALLQKIFGLSHIRILRPGVLKSAIKILKEACMKAILMPAVPCERRRQCTWPSRNLVSG